MKGGAASGTSTFVARAQAACIVFVLERMPWYTYFIKGVSAVSACRYRMPDQKYKVDTPREEAYCEAP